MAETHAVSVRIPTVMLAIIDEWANQNHISRTKQLIKMLDYAIKIKQEQSYLVEAK